MKRKKSVLGWALIRGRGFYRNYNGISCDREVPVLFATRKEAKGWSIKGDKVVRVELREATQ